MQFGYKGLRVYQLSYQLAQRIFQLTKTFPSEEKYSLISQIRNSSRSVVANIAEGYRKRKYPRHFALKMTEADGEGTETQVWLDMSKDCGYISNEEHIELVNSYQAVGDMLGKMIEHPEKFTPKSNYKDQKKNKSN